MSRHAADAFQGSRKDTTKDGIERRQTRRDSKGNKWAAVIKLFLETQLVTEPLKGLFSL